MNLFLSNTVNKVDKKGRTSLPATFRAVLSGKKSSPFAATAEDNDKDSADSPRQVILMPHIKTPCLLGMTHAGFEEFAAAADTFDAFSPQRDYLTHLIFGKSAMLSWDDTGRILLPEELRSHAKITDTAVFVGLGKSFEVWEPKAYEDMMNKARKEATDSGLTLPLMGAVK